MSGKVCNFQFNFFFLWIHCLNRRFLVCAVVHKNVVIFKIFFFAFSWECFCLLLEYDEVLNFTDLFIAQKVKKGLFPYNCVVKIPVLLAKREKMKWMWILASMLLKLLKLCQ